MKNYFEKDPHKIRLNIIYRKKLITEEQYNRIVEYLNSKDSDVYNLGINAIYGIINNSTQK